MTAARAYRLVPLGRIVRLQVQVEKIKTGEGIHQRYTPEQHLRTVEALWLDSGGVGGRAVDGEMLPDVHHRDHPRSRFRGANGISLLTTGHYAKMREHFGDHLTDGIASESVLVQCDSVMTLDDFVHGIVIGEGEDAVAIDTWEVAHPCTPFSRFALQFPDDQKPDRLVTEALQFLDNGTRGFNGLYHGHGVNPVEIRLGDMVYLRF
jgi:hypothetical protein